MLEARCHSCGETFVPHSEAPADLIHGETEAGKSCGGAGLVMGEWIAPEPKHIPWDEFASDFVE